MAGYRLRYDYGPVQDLVVHLGYEGTTLLDLIERLKVIESAVLEGESDRAEADEERRKNEQSAGQR